MRLAQLIARRRSVQIADFCSVGGSCHGVQTVVQAVPIDCRCPLIIPVEMSKGMLRVRSKPSTTNSTWKWELPRDSWSWIDLNPCVDANKQIGDLCSSRKACEKCRTWCTAPPTSLSCGKVLKTGRELSPVDDGFETPVQLLPLSINRATQPLWPTLIRRRTLCPEPERKLTKLQSGKTPSIALSKNGAFYIRKKCDYILNTSRNTTLVPEVISCSWDSTIQCICIILKGNFQWISFGVQNRSRCARATSSLYKSPPRCRSGLCYILFIVSVLHRGNQGTALSFHHAPPSDWNESRGRLTASRKLHICRQVKNSCAQPGYRLMGVGVWLAAPWLRVYGISVDYIGGNKIM